MTFLDRRSTTRPRPWLTALMIGVLALGANATPSWADQTIEKADKPVAVMLKTPLDSQTAKAGAPFEAELTEPLHYGPWTLPKGTRFTGRIMKANHSRTFERPGYVKLRAEEAVLPNGESFRFTGDDYGPRTHKITHKNAQPFLKGVAAQAPFTAIGLGVTIPLRATEAVTNWSTVPIGLGVRMLTGAIAGPFRKSGDYENRPGVYKVVRGALDGSGIPRVVHFLAVRDPEVSLAPGDTIPLRFDANALEALMRQASDQAGASTAAP